jgi:hypothetical protein
VDWSNNLSTLKNGRFLVNFGSLTSYLTVLIRGHLQPDLKNEVAQAFLILFRPSVKPIAMPSSNDCAHKLGYGKS